MSFITGHRCVGDDVHVLRKWGDNWVLCTLVDKSRVYVCGLGLCGWGLIVAGKTGVWHADVVEGGAALWRRKLVEMYGMVRGGETVAGTSWGVKSGG